MGLLIGAGAPFSIKVNPTTKELATDGEPLIPTVPALTAAVVAALSAEDKAIVERITAERGGKPNIEDILSRVRLLGRAIGTETVHGYDANHYETLGQSICNKIGQLVGPLLPLEPNPYTELVAWIGGTSRESAVEIFTTNYDLLIEEALERARVPYFDGFSGGHLPFFDPSSVASDDLPARWTRVWKLHGSLGWSFEGGQVVRDGQRTTTQLIYPDHLKYEQVQRLPYSALFERFRQFLLTPDTLLLCSGFSFVDAHVSSVLEEALSANANAAVFAFQYGSLESEGLACKLVVPFIQVSPTPIPEPAVLSLRGFQGRGSQMNDSVH